jgi:hypothetical protein
MLATMSQEVPSLLHVAIFLSEINVFAFLLTREHFARFQTPASCSNCAEDAYVCMLPVVVIVAVQQAKRSKIINLAVCRDSWYFIGRGKFIFIPPNVHILLNEMFRSADLFFESAFAPGLQCSYFINLTSSKINMYFWIAKINPVLNFLDEIIILILCDLTKI